MIRTKTENGLIIRWSDKKVYIKDNHSNSEHTSAIDYPDYVRVRLGFPPCDYVETDREIESYILENDPEMLEKAKAFDILIGGAV